MWKSFMKNKVLASLLINIILLCIEITWLSLRRNGFMYTQWVYGGNFLIGGCYDICSNNCGGTIKRMSLSKTVLIIIHPKSRSYFMTFQCSMELIIQWSQYFSHFLIHCLNLLFKRLNMQFNRTLLSMYTYAKILFLINE